MKEQAPGKTTTTPKQTPDSVSASFESEAPITSLSGTAQRAAGDIRNLSTTDVMRLQRTMGNRAVNDLLKPSPSTRTARPGSSQQGAVPTVDTPASVNASAPDQLQRAMSDDENARPGAVDSIMNAHLRDYTGSDSSGYTVDESKPIGEKLKSKTVIDVYPVFDKSGDWRMARHDSVKGFLRKNKIKIVESNTTFATGKGATLGSADVYAAGEQSVSMIKGGPSETPGSPPDADNLVATGVMAAVKGALNAMTGGLEEVITGALKTVQEALAGLTIPGIIGIVGQIIGAIDKYIDMQALKSARDEARKRVMASGKGDAQLDSTNDMELLAMELLSRPVPSLAEVEQEEAVKATDQKVLQAAEYGYNKVRRGFWERLSRTIISVGQAVVRIITVLTGGASALVTQAIDLGLALAKAGNTIYKKAKGLYKAVRGTRGVNREKNAKELVRAAMQGNDPAIRLIHTVNPFSTLTKWKRRITRSYPTIEELKVMLPAMDPTDQAEMESEMASKLKSQ